jgi:hypothetical protein
MDFAAAGRHNLCPAAARHSKPEGMIAGVGATPSRLKENDNQRVANAEQFSRTLVNFRSLWLDCNKNARIWSLESYLITPFDTGGADDHRSRQLGSRL